jgi:hypothetical protein
VTASPADRSIVRRHSEADLLGERDEIAKVAHPQALPHACGAEPTMNAYIIDHNSDGAFKVSRQNTALVMAC